MSVESGWPVEYDLGIKDYLVGGAVWVVGLLTRQMGHNPARAQQEAPMVPSEQLPIERLSQMMVSHELES